MGDIFYQWPSNSFPSVGRTAKIMDTDNTNINIMCIIDFFLNMCDTTWETLLLIIIN